MATKITQFRITLNFSLEFLTCHVQYIGMHSNEKQYFKFLYDCYNLQTK